MSCPRITYYPKNESSKNGFNFCLTSEKSKNKERRYYRFGFNGMEKDNEVKGVGNSLDFGARIYDSRLGRWLSLDPLMAKYPMLSAYIYTSNNPIIYVDKDGRDQVLFNMKGQEIGRVVTDKVHETYVMTRASFFSIRQAQMPNIIQKFNDYNGGSKSTTDSKYQKYDYNIAAETFIFNYNKNNNQVPTVNGEMMENASKKVPDLDVNDVKGICMMESQMGTYDANTNDRNDSKSDIMQANVFYSEASNDWNSDKAQFGLTKGGGVATPQQSIKAGIGLLFIKGLRDPNNKGYLQTKNWYGGKDWSNAIRDYNGKSKPRPAFGGLPQKEVYKNLIKQENKASVPQQ